MSNYVLSDVHAHYRTLYRLLEKVGPLSSDRIWVLGDMVDYGPNPVAVMRLLKGLPHCTVLLGDHEDMMLDCFMHPHDEGKRMRWMLDGGATTLDALRSLPTNTAFDLIDWVKGLPLTAYAITGPKRPQRRCCATNHETTCSTSRTNSGAGRPGLSTSGATGPS